MVFRSPCMALRGSLLILMLAMAIVAESAAWDAGAHWGLTHFLSSVRNNNNNYELDSTKTCNGRVGDCIDEEEEMMMASEISRRELQGAAKKWISYGALQKDRVPCNRRGQSYYNCQKSKRANPYRRGCTVITRCYRYTN